MKENGKVMEIKIVTQNEIANALSKKTNNVVELKNLSDKPLMSQVKAYNADLAMPKPCTIEGVVVGYKSDSSEDYFILSDENIFENVIQNEIKQSLGIDNAAIIFEPDEGKIDYKSKERAKDFEFNGRKFKAYTDPISHPDDQVKIRVVEDIEKPKPKSGRKVKM